MAGPQHFAKPPKTPLTRLSRNSLRSQTLSASHAIPTSEDHTYFDHQQPNHHAPLASSSASIETLSTLFGHLSNSFANLHLNLTNLDAVSQTLDGFNQSFGALIYGLRMNAYLTEFDQAPRLSSFHFHAHNQLLHNQQQLLQNLNIHLDPQNAAQSANLESTEQEASLLESSEILHHSHPPHGSSSKPTPALTSTASGSITHTTGQAPSHHSTNSAPNAKKKRTLNNLGRAEERQLSKYTQSIISALPIKYREQQPFRNEMESVISLLKLNNHLAGLQLKEILKLSVEGGNHHKPLTLHRIRECCNALVNAKQALKISQDGLLFKLIV